MVTWQDSVYRPTLLLQDGRPQITMTSTRLWRPAILVKTRVWVGCSVSWAHKTWSFKTPSFTSVLAKEGSLYDSGKLPTYHSPSVSVNVGLGEGQVSSFPETHNDPKREYWNREGILRRWPGYVIFTKVIFRGCN